MGKTATALDDLTNLIALGIPERADMRSLAEKTSSAIDKLFGERYRSQSPRATRVAFMPGDDNVPFAGFLHPNSPPSGVYGGMSIIWFPITSDDNRPASSLLTFVCGTKGLDPDASILGRPGHIRYLNALRRHFAKEYDVQLWVKSDPTDLSQPFPKIILGQYPQFDRVIERYGRYIYAAVEVPNTIDVARHVVGDMLDFYAKERGWTYLTAALKEKQSLEHNLTLNLFPKIDLDDLYQLLLERRFVILQGPPGTGKTRLASLLLSHKFEGSGKTVQFHPAVTYETFVVGISPAVQQATLNFEIRPGWLIEAIRKAASKAYLLTIDEINRADLGRVLGEAIYLFEPREISRGVPRSIDSPLPIPGMPNLEIPPNLYVIGTMNSADRSIAILDLAVRRRFAFVDIWPDFEVIQRQENELASAAFSALIEIFTQYAPDDAMVLLPGHAYFLAESPMELTHRLKYELIPLLNEYLHEGRLGPCESEIHAYLTWLEGEIAHYD